ncbi:MAG: DUF3365 domain-containing protein [bacterium]
MALQLASLLQSARSVVASEQAHINDASLADKGLSGDVVLARATAEYLKKTGTDLAAISPDSVNGKLLAAMSGAVRQVMDENAASINHPGIGFKGFVPAVFARLVNEHFGLAAGDAATIKVTAPLDLVRNRRARPDAWEAAVINDHLMSPDWAKGEVYSELTEVNGRKAFRAMVPEYYGEGCLACHGAPKGEIDITGYPKEGGKLGDLGGVISITLFQ